MSHDTAIQVVTSPPQHSQMQLGFRGRVEGQETSHTTTLADDKATDLYAVLTAIKALLVTAGFDYVVSVAVETENGAVIFGDELI